MTITQVTTIALLAPLVGSMIAGFFGKTLGRQVSHCVTILGVLVSFLGALWLCKAFFLQGASPVDSNLFAWVKSGGFQFDFGYLVDHLTVVMMTIVTFVSLLVHIYSIGYMNGDKGYQRFFAYMSLFTFAMLLLVTANNFTQLFFGWEGVGLVSYLLIGFWFNKESAAQGSLKAFIVNRVGDFGFILGIAAVLDYFGTLDYHAVFTNFQHVSHMTITVFPGVHWSVSTLICMLLFIGAMGKSAQIPLHVWLPESMEGPTPISALIHAATMVTAGVFMVARLSPMFNYSVSTLEVVMVIGALGGLFLGILALVEDDIKRVVAYSTMSQLGYMMAACGAAAYSAGIFHLISHACFKALLFLAAGSVIIGMHHEQNMRKMGGLRKYMPITYVTFLIGALALAAIPPFSGFYSKDAIIEAVHLSSIPGATFSYWCLLLGGLVTSLYIFRAFILTFHGKEKFDADTRSHIHESPWTMVLPLILLAIPSVILGGYLAKHFLYSGETNILAGSIQPMLSNNPLTTLASNYHGWLAALPHALTTLPFWFAIAGLVLAIVCYALVPSIPEKLRNSFGWIYRILIGQYGFDKFNDWFFVRGFRHISEISYKYVDSIFIDKWFVDGSGHTMGFFSRVLKRMQTGYLYHYALVMIVGLLALLIWLIFFPV